MYADHRLEYHKEWWKVAEPFFRQLAKKDIMETMATRARDDVQAATDREVFGSIERSHEGELSLTA